MLSALRVSALRVSALGAFYANLLVYVANQPTNQQTNTLTHQDPNTLTHLHTNPKQIRQLLDSHS